NDRRLPFDTPGRSLHHIGTEARLVPEIYLGVFAFGRCGNARIGLPLPSLDRLWVTLIGTSERLLWRQSHGGEHFADRGEAQLDVELVRNHLGDDLARPQTKIKPILTRVFAVDPTKDLPLSRFRQLRRRPVALRERRASRPRRFPSAARNH